MKGIKKFLFLMATTVLFVLAALGMTACGGDKDDGADVSQYAGTYKVESLCRRQGISEKTYNVGDSLKPALSTMENEFGADTLTDDYLVIELKADGTATVNSKISTALGGFQGEKTGAWSINKDKVVELKALTDNLTSMKSTSAMIIDEGKLRILCILENESSVEYTLAK